VDAFLDFFLYGSFLAKPIWMWTAFIAIIIILLALDLGVFHRRDEEIGLRESVAYSVFYIVIALIFGTWIWWQMGQQSALEYYTGYIIEKTLSMDNIFVMAVIFSAFSIPRIYQHRVLFWGIMGVIILRGIMIGVGAYAVHEMEWILYIFAAFLIFTGIKLLLTAGKEEEDHSEKVTNNPLTHWLSQRFNVTEEITNHNFFRRMPDKNDPSKMRLYITPLFLALVTIEFADLIFAVDSIPAIFSITTDTYVIYTSNIFAILGLRSLYFLLSAMLVRFVYLKHTLAIVLTFIGCKVFAPLFLPIDKVPAEFSLTVTVTLLAAGIIYSLYKTREQDAKKAK